MREELLALEEKLRNNIFEFANENNNKSVEEILAMLGIKEYTLKDSVYHFTTYEIDTNDLVHMTYKKDRLHVLYTRDVKVINFAKELVGRPSYEYGLEQFMDKTAVINAHAWITSTLTDVIEKC